MGQPNKSRWYKDAFIYQIYPRSFCDSNEDGIGDIPGIISKLDYIKDLGVDAIWLSPCFKSPNDDNGYDISDYRDIMDEFGTLNDFKDLLAEVHSRGMKLILDLVANHTSDEHFWFTESKKSKDNPYRDYYFWRPGKNNDGKVPPNNWTSRMGGSAWEYDETTNEWYLHLFSKKQPDLNWDNVAVRQEITDICNYWLEMGVDGFRCDVITYISKCYGMPDGKFKFSGTGDEYFTHGPNIHEYLKEINLNSWSLYDTFIIGEAAGATTDKALEYISENSNELDSLFHFEHYEKNIKYSLFQGKFKLKPIKSIFSHWQNALQGKGWNSLYLENHDQPRCINAYAPDAKNNKDIAAKMLAIALFMQQGTPFIFQGQEIGMTNYPFKNYDDFRDVKVSYLKSNLKFLAKPLEKRIVKMLCKTGRDNARTPMQWDTSFNAGFSTGKPWIAVNPNYTGINVRSQTHDNNSVLNFYKDLIKFRKGNATIINGIFKENFRGNRNIYCYERWWEGQRIFVVCNFRNKSVPFKEPCDLAYINSHLELHNYGYDRPVLKSMILRPYEALVYTLM